MHYFQFEIKEWVSNTAHLSLEEEAVYLRLINFYYDSEKPIPLDPTMVFRKLRIADIRLGENILDEFFKSTSEGYIHDRCDVEIAKFHAKQEQASRAGKASAERRFNASSTTVQPIINQESLIINQKPIKTTAPKVATPDGVSVDLWNDFLIYRKRLKAPVTDRVLARLIKEANLAKMPLSDVLETIIFKGWRSFEASWMQQAAQIAQKAKELPLGSDKQIEEAYRIECGGDPAKARFNSYFEMKKFILDQRDKRKPALLKERLENGHQ